MSDLEIALKEIIDNYKNQGHPINIAIKDIAREFGISEQQISLYVERLLGEEDQCY